MADPETPARRDDAFEGDPDALISDAMLDELLAVDELLTRMEAENPLRARIVECRLFGGMGLDEVAYALELSTEVVTREWRIAAARLYQQLQTRAADS